MYEERPRDEVVSSYPLCVEDLNSGTCRKILALRAARAQPDEVVVGLQPKPNIAVTITGSCHRVDMPV